MADGTTPEEGTGAGSGRDAPRFGVAHTDATEHSGADSPTPRSDAPDRNPADPDTPRPNVSVPEAPGATRPYGTAQGQPPPAATPYGTVHGTSSPAGTPSGPPPTPSPYRTSYGQPSAPDAQGGQQAWNAPGATSHPPGSADWQSPQVGGPRYAAPPPPVAPEDLARARRLARLGLYCAVIGVIFSLIFFPVGFVLDIVAITLGIRARRAAVRAQESEGAGVVAVVMGGIGLSLALVLGSMLAVFWTEIRAYQSCSGDAITHSAQSVCETTLQEDIKRRLGMG